MFTGGRDQRQEGAEEWCGGARPHTRKWRAGAGSGPGAGASWPPSAAHLLSPGRGQGEEVAAASNMSGQGKKRRDMTDVSPPVTSHQLHVTRWSLGTLSWARRPHVQMDGGMNVPLTHIECA